MVLSYGLNQVILRQNRISPYLYGPVSYYLDNDSHSVKPASSKAGNSELYLVMENYSGEMHPLQNSDSFLSNLLETIFNLYSYGSCVGVRS